MNHSLDTRGLNNLVLWKSLKYLLKTSPFERNARSMTCAPLLNRRVNNDLVLFIPRLQDAPAQFINIPYLPPVHFLLHRAPNCVYIVDRIQVRTIWRPHCNLILTCEHRFSSLNAMNYVNYDVIKLELIQFTIIILKLKPCSAYV